MKSVSLGEKRLVSSAAVCFGMLLAATVVRAQETKEKVIVDDVERSFMVRLPRSYDAQQHYPVVILLHGTRRIPQQSAEQN